MSDALARFERLKTTKQIVSNGESKQGFDPWENVLRTVETRSGVFEAVDSNGRREWRVRSRYLLTSVIGIAPERVNGSSQGTRLGVVMRRLNWIGPQYLYFGNKQYAKGYRKSSG
jgi:hypothetical protein